MTRIQQTFLAQLSRLAALLDDTSPTIHTLLKELFFASATWQGGIAFEECKDFALRRLSWRVRDDLASQSSQDAAQQLLAAIVPRGMQVFRQLDTGGVRVRL